MSAGLRHAVGGPRYGSPAQLAAYSGLSVKTVRRLVGSGQVAAHRVGRRVVIPFDELDRCIGRGAAGRGKEPAAMSVANPTAGPHRSVDASGRALPLTGDEVRSRAAAAVLALDGLDDMGGADEQRDTLAELVRAVDSEPLSDRRRFG